jgi:hypothetical protein
VWPHLLKPTVAKGSAEGATPKYQINMLVPKASNIDLLKEIAKKAKEEKFGTREIPKFKTPFHRTAEQERLLDYKDEYPLLIRASSTDAPQVINAKLQLVTDEAEIYGGRWASVSVNAYAWEHPTGGKGVSFGLANVQLLDHDDPIANSRVAASTEFESVDDGSGGAAGSTDSLFGDDEIPF